MSLFAFIQWHAVRRENSYDKYYERLDRANIKGGVNRDSRQVVEHLTSPHDFERALYVYSELDNLEYVIGKYKLGHMNREDAFRGLTCFISRCRSEYFNTLAKELVRRGGYKPDFVKTVNIIIDKYRHNPKEIDALFNILYPCATINTRIF